MDWLLQDDALRELQALARRERAALDGFQPQAARVLTTAGDTAEITVGGVLTDRSASPFLSVLARGTDYADIRSALAEADADPNIKRAVLRVRSPGGMTAGLFETVDAIERFSKPIIARASRAQSAAYALAAATARIEAEGRDSEFGSIGVAVTILLFEDELTLTNTDSPEKRPDPRTPEGKASIVRRLDAINELFVEAIARGRTRAGRSTSSARVKAGFGRGASLLADEALQLGMIDAVIGYAGTAADTSTSAPEGDLGDQVVAILEERRGHTGPQRARAQGGAPTKPRDTDLGDQVVEILNRKGWR